MARRCSGEGAASQHVVPPMVAYYATHKAENKQTCGQGDGQTGCRMKDWKAAAPVDWGSIQRAGSHKQDANRNCKAGSKHTNLHQKIAVHFFFGCRRPDAWVRRDVAVLAIFGGLLLLRARGVGGGLFLWAVMRAVIDCWLASRSLQQP